MTVTDEDIYNAKTVARADGEDGSSVFVAHIRDDLFTICTSDGGMGGAEEVVINADGLKACLDGLTSIMKYDDDAAKKFSVDGLNEMTFTTRDENSCFSGKVVKNSYHFYSSASIYTSSSATMNRKQAKVLVSGIKKALKNTKVTK